MIENYDEIYKKTSNFDKRYNISFHVVSVLMKIKTFNKIYFNFMKTLHLFLENLKK